MKKLSFGLKVFITLFVLCISGIVFSTIAIDKQIDSYIEEMKTEVKIEVVNNSDNEVMIVQEGNNIIVNINPKESTPVTQEDNEEKAIEMYGIVTSEIGLNVREQPRLDSDKVGTLEYGAKVKILEEVGDWYKTDSGYIFKEYVIKI
jgi:uncharacterized protein YgiM (DUF1202 family)